MESEYRAMILHGDIIDVRRYKGDWSLAPDRETVEDSGSAPASYTLDFAVERSFDDIEWMSINKTVLVEANDGFAFGNYGLLPEAYASCLAARWKEMVE